MGHHNGKIKRMGCYNINERRKEEKKKTLFEVGLHPKFSQLCRYNAMNRTCIVSSLLTSSLGRSQLMLCLVVCFSQISACNRPDFLEQLSSSGTNECYHEQHICTREISKKCQLEVGLIMCPLIVCNVEALHPLEGGFKIFNV